MPRKPVLATIIASSLLLAGCTQDIERQSQKGEPPAAPSSFIGLASPVDLPFQDNYVNALIGFSEPGDPRVLKTSPVVYSNTLMRFDDGFAFATPTGVEVYDDSGLLNQKYEAEASGMLMLATSSANYSHVSFAHNVSSPEQPERHSIQTISDGGQRFTESNSFPMGLTTCDDGRVMWVDVDGSLPVMSENLAADERVAVLVRADSDGTVTRTPLSDDIPLAGNDAVIDCDSENASFTVFDEQQNVQLIVVEDAFSSEVRTSWVKLDPPPPTSTLPRNGGAYNGTYFSVLNDGSVSIRKGFQEPVLFVEKLDLDGDKPLFATFDGAFVTVVHYLPEDDSISRATVFSLDDFSCHSSPQPLDFWGSDEISSLNASSGSNLHLSAVLPVEKPVRC